MNKQYIIPVVGRTYTSRNGQEYRCTRSYFRCRDEQKQRALTLGECIATMERVKDGWTLDAHGVLEYEDGTIEWNYSTHGYFAKNICDISAASYRNLNRRPEGTTCIFADGSFRAVFLVRS